MASYGSDHDFQAEDDMVALIRTIQRTAVLSHWDPALRAAPEAIVAMAICMRAACKPEAKAIDMKTEWVDIDGEIIKFPSEFLDTNLQYCSNLGRKAFREAESGMNKLQLDLDNILGRHGTIRSIVSLLDRPSRARRQLRVDIDNLQASATGAKNKAEAMKLRFDRLMKFVEALNNATKHRQGMTSKQQDENEKNAINENKKIADLEENLKLLKNNMIKEQKALEDADASFRITENILNQAHEESLNTKSQVSTDDIANLVNNVVREPEKEFSGVWTATKRFLVGKDDKTKRYDRDMAQERDKQRAQATQELLDKKQRADDATRENALKVMTEAKLEKDIRKKAFEDARAEWEKAKNTLQFSTNTLKNSERILMQLGKEKLDLKQTREILQESLKALGNFKRRIDDLLAYFEENAAQADSLTSDSGPLGKILQAIENVSIESGNAEGARVINNFQIDPETKEAILNQVLQLEGRLIFVYEIASIYRYVSKKFIIPGMNKMEELAEMSDREYFVMKDDLIDWCSQAKEEIEAIASDGGKTTLNNKVARILWDRATKMKLIEPNGAMPDIN